jgi:Core-2/I-Branching enzyme
MADVAFVILSHDSPTRLLRLVKTLVALYDNPHIVCHHNFTRCPLEITSFPHTVRFVHPHIDARWGDLSLVQAGLAGIDRLCRLGTWDWFFLLSGSDYPISGPKSVRGALARADYDVLIDSRPVKWARLADGPDATGQFSFSRPYWSTHAYERYLMHQLPIPTLTKRLRPRTRYVQIWYSPLLRLLGRWPKGFTIHGGDLWFGGNRRTADLLLSHPKRRSILEFLAHKEIPEEAVYQTLIGNSDLVQASSKRFTKWPENTAHPKWLGAEDLTDMINSGAWFARKFLPDDPVLNALDRYLGI